MVRCRWGLARNWTLFTCISDMVELTCSANSSSSCRNSLGQDLEPAPSDAPATTGTFFQVNLKQSLEGQEKYLKTNEMINCGLRCSLLKDCTGALKQPRKDCKLIYDSEFLKQRSKHENEVIMEKTEMNPCIIQEPCKNGGTCKMSLTTDSGVQINCICPPLYTGNFCESAFTAKTCVELKRAYPGKHIPDKLYKVSLFGNEAVDDVFCDMNTNNGGWMLVSRYHIRSARHLPKVNFTGNFHTIKNPSENFIISQDALRNLYALYRFTQIRFKCFKKTRGRIVDIATARNISGEAVLNFFVNDGRHLPSACGSYEILPSNTADIPLSCHLWGRNVSTCNSGTWSWHSFRNEMKLVDHPLFICNKQHFLLQNNGRIECDDVVEPSNLLLSDGDTWEIFVR